MIGTDQDHPPSVEFCNSERKPVMLSRMRVNVRRKAVKMHSVWHEMYILNGNHNITNGYKGGDMML